MGIPCVHQQTLLAASMHSHTSSSACHVCMLLITMVGRGDCIVSACYWTTLQSSDFRRRCRLQLNCRRQLCSGSTSGSLSVPATSVPTSVGVPIQSREIYFPPGTFISPGINIPNNNRTHGTQKMKRIIKHNQNKTAHIKLITLSISESVNSSNVGL